MPFKRGVAPVRRTLKYLEGSPIVFKDKVKVLLVNYNEQTQNVVTKQRKTSFPHHEGAKDFVFWTLPQIQYTNKNLQIATFKNMTPSPFITCFLDNGRKILFDVDGQNKDDIVERLKKTLGKTEETLRQEALEAEKKDNPANFGLNCDQFCICNVPGQVPCPSFIPLPNHWRGKIVNAEAEED